METLFAGEELVGEVLGVVYADRATGFGVVELDAEGADETTAGARCAGPLADLVEGQSVRLVGSWREHPRYGLTFEATFYEQTVPTTVAGLRTFLLSDRFEGTDPATIERLLDVFGRRTGTVIEGDPGRLVSEAGVDPELADELHEQWMQGLALAELVRLVEPAGVPYAIVRGVFARLGTDAARTIREDPYAVLEVERCRFSHADAIGRHLGVAADDPRRLAAAARAAHAAARRQHGHEYLTRAQCAERAAGLLGSDEVLGVQALDHALTSGRLVTDVIAGEEVVYVTAGRRAEREVATDLQRLAGARSRLRAVEASTAPELTDGQRRAVESAVTTPVSVITGGPGTGKTRSIAEIVALAAAGGLNVALCAPTGRAAKRMEELVDHPATTIHRLLDARPEEDGTGFTFGYDEIDRLPHDLVICDEVSMCDTRLAAALVAAVEDGAHLVLVGDPDQLPSVGSGDVLRDLVASGAVPTTRLTEVHRQAARSRIVGLAREVNEGALGTLAGVDRDVFIAEEPVRARIVPRIVEAVARRVPDHLGVEPQDVQVLAPVYRGEAGVDALNGALKEALNPGSGPKVGRFHVGDRVMQTRNDPERDVSNGDIGHVTDVDASAGELRVAFPRNEVVYSSDRVGQLVHAWAITVHKAQGGEWPVVVFVCDRSHRGMLWRNLAYTAITRAQRALIMVGQRAALIDAAAHDRPRNRQTGLAWRLQQVADPNGGEP